MELTKEEALKLHHQMWSDMQHKLGDYPSYRAREQYKESWCRERFPNKNIAYNCFLCEYDRQFSDKCEDCPIVWPNERCAIGKAEERWYEMPISKLLVLPEREAK